MTRGLLVRLFALAMAVVVWSPAAAMAHLLCDCRAMGTMSAHACCKAKAKARAKAKAEASSHRAPDHFERAACCTTRWVSVEQAPAVTVSTLELHAIPPAGVSADSVLLLLGAFRADHARTPAQARAPPPRAPPLYLQHQSFLN